MFTHESESTHACNFTVFSKMKYFSSSHSHNVFVVVSWKRCEELVIVTTDH